VHGMAKQEVLKLVASGHIIEAYVYGGGGIWVDFVSQGGRNKVKEATLEDAEKNRQDASKRSRQNVRRQVNANFVNVQSRFITLTFRDGAVFDVTDVQECNKAFKTFIQRLRYEYGDFKYLAVIEFQDATGRGAVHYHMIATLPYIKSSVLADIWGNGFVKINKIDHVDNIGAYLVKYMLKDVSDTRLKGQKAYLSGRNLDKPTILRGDDARRVIEAYKLGTDVAVSYSSTYTLPPEMGSIAVFYSEFNLLRPDGQKPNAGG